MELALSRKINPKDKFIACYNDDTCFIKYEEGISSSDLTEHLMELTPIKLKEMLKKGGTKKEALLDLLDKRCRSEKYLLNSKTEFEYKDKSVKMLPDLTVERECIYIYGSSGCGKSYLSKEYAKLYKKYYKDNDIFLVSSLDFDKTLADLKCKRIPLNIDVLSKISLDTLENSLIIFDDSDTPSDKEVQKMIDNLKDEIAQKGRHTRTSAIFTTHMACNFNRTRVLLNECCKFVIFPGAGGLKQQERLLVTYGGLDPIEFKRLIKLKSKWLMFYNRFPNYIMHQSGVKLL